MKKVLSLICLLCCLFLLFGCDPGTHHIDKDELIANTVKIELYDYENEDPKLLRINGKKKPKFDFDDATFIATLDESHFDAILEDIAAREYLDFGTALNEPMGKTLVLHQSNGNIIVLFGCTYTDEDDETRYSGECYVFDEYGALVEYIGRVGHTFSDHIVSTYFQGNS